MPNKNNSGGPNLYCAVIVKKVDEKTRSKTSINDLLRDQMPIINEISLSKDLIKYPSITPIDAGIMKFLSKKLNSLGFKCKILEFKREKVNQ